MRGGRARVAGRLPWPATTAGQGLPRGGPFVGLLRRNAEVCLSVKAIQSRLQKGIRARPRTAAARAALRPKLPGQLPGAAGGRGVCGDLNSGCVVMGGPCVQLHLMQSPCTRCVASGPRGTLSWLPGNDAARDLPADGPG